MNSKLRQTKEGIWTVNGDTHIGAWVEEKKRLDHDRTIDRLLEFIPVGGVVVDAGAAIGDHTIAYARKIGLFGDVFAFEPNKLEFACLTMNMIEFENVTPINFGLGLHSEMLAYEIDETCPGSSRVVPHGKSSINIITLEDCVGEIIRKTGRFDFLKIDVEGMELEVIAGARLLIDQFNPVIFCEVNRGRLAEHGISGEVLMEHIKAIGYTIDNFDLNAPNDFSLEQFDIICKPVK